MTQPQPPRIDSSDAWRDVASSDLAETLRAKLTPASQPTAGVNVQISAVHGDIINLGSMTPEALREFFAARKR